MTGWRDRPLADLLAEHGLTGLPEGPFPTDGWSGSTFSTLDTGTRRFVLKRVSPERDWIVRATQDHELREAWIASAGDPEGRWLQRFGAAIFTSYLGAAADTDGSAVILMPDLLTELVAWERPVHEPVLEPAAADRFLDRMALLHAMPWSEVLTAGTEAAPWCPLAERLTLLTRRSALAYAAEGNPVGDRFLALLDAFDRAAPGATRDLLARLGEDPTPLLTALARLPAVGLHGDLKLANVALVRGGVSLIDWQMTLVAPVAVELGWAIVVNSAELPFAPEEFLRRYLQEVTWYARVHRSSGPTGRGLDGLVGDWELQVDLAIIVGLLLRGWRKGLDADAGVTLAYGAQAIDDLEWWATRAVDAAERRL